MAELKKLVQKELPEVETNETPRIKIGVESLSDMIFGLALSIGAIFLI